MNREIIFSHRPVAGVSVAACSENGKLFIATALTNDGMSRNGRMHSSRRDSFSRATARHILTGRIESMIAGNPIPRNTMIVNTEISARTFMHEFRKSFKPTVDESDTVLTGVAQFGGVETRFRPTATEIFNKISDLAIEVVAKNEVPF